jgi:hypothetical protein
MKFSVLIIIFCLEASYHLFQSARITPVSGSSTFVANKTLSLQRIEFVDSRRKSSPQLLSVPTFQPSLQVTSRAPFSTVNTFNFEGHLFHVFCC